MKFLEERGYEIVRRNFYSKHGEIDVIANDEGYLCFVEVKYRTAPGYGYPEEAVDFNKMRNICKAASYYLYKNGVVEGTPVRFDVVSIDGEDIRLIKNAFDYCL